MSIRREKLIPKYNWRIKFPILFIMIDFTLLKRAEFQTTASVSQVPPITRVRAVVKTKHPPEVVGIRITVTSTGVSPLQRSTFNSGRSRNMTSRLDLAGVGQCCAWHGRVPFSNVHCNNLST